MTTISSPRSSQTTHNLATLILRVSMGGLMLLGHGWHKLTHFSEMQNKFFDFLGFGSEISLGLAVFAEFFCALFVIFGLFTRLAVIPLMILLTVAVSIAHNMDVLGHQTPVLFLTGFLAIFILGPGKISLDGLINK